MTIAFTPPHEDREHLRTLAEHLAQAGGQVEILFGEGTQAQRITLTPLLAKLLQTSLQELGAGHTVALVTTEEEVTPARAARLLGVSRPHVVNTLLQTGEIPYRMVGKHHRIAVADLLAYQTECAQRHAAADALSQLSEDLDLYAAEYKATLK
ncbi:helix-turn-helix domain-containing protein [Deinococcus sp. AJ005]|uniref:helix-turn-helix domain-containing protein n=1 Tax=Deinococcus sp. AJ005 TaxID=2652443 RepID=UPI00125CAE8F|nr:helix-turn-helix domain-containing protein [Deinococcus sp. AJ005]QFP75003.1 helix-turn-helix domain-containing protein [Deinococcus sp. AJ005]